MIIWKGWGFIVFINTFLLSLAGEIISESITKDDNFYQSNSIPITIVFMLSGVINGFLGKWLNSRNAKTHIDKETNQEITIKNKHSLFFIPMEYWGVILIFCSILLFIFK